MINFRLLAHPTNWAIVGAVLLFWATVAYLISVSIVDRHHATAPHNSHGTPAQ